MSIGHLHDDELLYLAKHFLSDKDCLALALSGANESFTRLFGNNRKRLVISRCYFLGSNGWNKFFQEYITPLTIISFDVSHCYWLPAELLSLSITKMINLEELIVQDTQVSLAYLPKVFEACKEITKFSFTLAEKNLDLYQDNVMAKSSLDWLKKGFSRLTHLKIFTADLNVDSYYNESWLVTLGVLKWCRDCKNLLIEIAYAYVPPTSAQSRSEDFERVIQFVCQHLFPHLGWMSSLESLAILKRGSPYSAKDFFIYCLLNWLFRQLKKSPNNKLERLWIDEQISGIRELSENSMRDRSVKSIILSEAGNGSRFELNEERFRHLEHLAGINFYNLAEERFPDLKFFRGKCPDSNEDFNDFCESHPDLEYLMLDITSNPVWDIEEETNYYGKIDWTLLMLKVLVYRCDAPNENIMEILINCCPNIEEFHIGMKFEEGHPLTILRSVKSLYSFSDIQFENLTWLSLTGFELLDGSYLPSIAKQCPKLERLHLSGSVRGIEFFNHLAACLPISANLRDLRLEWNYDTRKFNDDEWMEEYYVDDDDEEEEEAPPETSKCVLLVFRALLKCASHFERLVLVANECGGDNLTEPTDVLLLPFVEDMKHLVALCLVGFQIDPRVNEVVKRRLTKEILPNRLPFWFHLGDKLPKENDSSVPKVHYDEVVNPIDAFNAPPEFW